VTCRPAGIVVSVARLGFSFVAIATRKNS